MSTSNAVTTVSPVDLREEKKRSLEKLYTIHTNAHCLLTVLDQIFQAVLLLKFNRTRRQLLWAQRLQEVPGPQFKNPALMHHHWLREQNRCNSIGPHQIPVGDVAGMVDPHQLAEALPPPSGQLQSDMEGALGFRYGVPPAEPAPLVLCHLLLKDDNQSVYC